jgi:transposase
MWDRKRVVILSLVLGLPGIGIATYFVLQNDSLSESSRRWMDPLQGRSGKTCPKRFGSKSAVHRWFQRWVEDRVFETIMREAGRLVEERDGYRLYECHIDGTFSKARGGGDGIGSTKAGKGVKIMVLVDAKGLPVAVDTTSASPHESQLVQRLFDFMLTEETPERIIGDKAYDSDALDAQLDEQGIELIAPHRSNRKKQNKTQDGRALRRYKRRWTVERTIAWIQHYRRLCIRWEKSMAMTHLPHLSGESFTASAYCQARQRLPQTLLKTLVDRFNEQLDRPRQSPLWHGHRVFIADGSGFSMPDTPELQAHFGQPGNQKTGCGFPVAHILALFDAEAGFLRDVSVHPLRTQDFAHVAKLHPKMAPGDILVGDRGFCSYGHLALILQANLHGVLRVHQRTIVDFRSASALCKQGRCERPSPVTVDSPSGAV